MSKYETRTLFDAKQTLFETTNLLGLAEEQLDAAIGYTNRDDILDALDDIESMVTNAVDQSNRLLVLIVKKRLELRDSTEDKVCPKCNGAQNYRKNPPDPEMICCDECFGIGTIE